MGNAMTYQAVLLGAAAMLAACDNGRAATEPGRQLNGETDPSAPAYQRTLETRNDVEIVRATGDITDGVARYRALFSKLNPNVAGEQDTSGRREINWDGVPATFTNNDLFPGNFFNVNSPRGALFTTPGSAFRISNNGYTDVNAAYAGEFNTFSPPKLFVARGSTIIDVTFAVAGSGTPARVNGFGSVFADVGRAHSTTIEYFDAAGNSLLKIAAPRASDEKGLSFLGAKFTSPIVARVRITAGDTPIDAAATDNVKGAGQKHDIVATDDFIYGEPRAIR